MNNIKLKNKLLINTIKYLFILGLFFVLSNAKIVGCSPFCVALLFALMWTGFNVWIVSGEYFLLSMLTNLSLENLYVHIVVVFVLIVTYFLHKQIKRPMNVGVVVLYAILANSCFLYYSMFNMGWLRIVVYFILLIISLLMFVTVFQLTLLRGIYYKLTLNESIAFVYCLICLGIGLSGLEIYHFSVLKFVTVFLILFMNFIKKDKEAIFVALSLGVGGFIGTLNGEILSNIVIILLASTMFRYPQKYLVCIGVVLVDCCGLFYIYKGELHALFELLPTLVAMSLVVLIPNKFIGKLQDKFYICESEMSMRNIVNLTRSNLHRRFNELSNVFNEMKAIHLGLIKDEISSNQLVNMLSKELMGGFCKDCLNRQKCYRVQGDDEFATVAKLVDIALKKGKLTLLDIPSNLAIRCGMVNLLIGRVNQMLEQYKQFAGIKKDINNVKYLLAEQLGAVGQIMLELGEELDSHIKFDAHKESQIMGELLAENIVCSEILLYNEKDQDVHVELIVKGENAYNPKIVEILSKKLKIKMAVMSVKPIEVSDFYSVTLEVESHYDIVFGLASFTKTGSEASGDSHSLLKLGKNKYLLALCDGMGSGETANKTSALTIGLIENFYKAGFNNDIVISSVNKLLTINNQEDFATLDLCMLDLNKEIVDFIKIGSPYSVIKRESEIETIEGGALPVGVLDCIQPYSYQTTIDTKSMIVMMTDGVTDAFKSKEDMEDFIKGVASNNPQTVAQTVIDEAVRRNGGISKDDMTILVVRTFRKNI